MFMLMLMVEGPLAGWEDEAVDVVGCCGAAPAVGVDELEADGSGAIAK